MTRPYDVVVIGGGVIGASFACALAGSSLRVAVIEAGTSAVFSGCESRGLALSLSSKNIFSALGLWQTLLKYAIPIKKIHVSDQHHFGCVRMSTDTFPVDAFGYVVSASELHKSCMRKIYDAPNIEVFCPALMTNIEMQTNSIKITARINDEQCIFRSKLLVAADGTNSFVRKKIGIGTKRKDYRQTAIITQVLAEQWHNYTAYERFTKQGPLAILPYMQKRCAVVLTVNTEKAGHFLKMGEEDFLHYLLGQFGRRLGKFSCLGERKAYPLWLVEARHQIYERLVILGDAAHTIHPNGAQGFNLGLRDAVALADSILTSSDQDIDRILRAYLSSRRNDQRMVIKFSDLLASCFYNQQATKVMLRNIAMLGIDLLPPLKNALIKYAMGFYGGQATLAAIDK